MPATQAPNSYIPHFTAYMHQRPENIPNLFQTDILEGLSCKQVRQHEITYGANKITEQSVQQWWHILGRQCTSLFIAVFITLGLLSLLLHQYTNALIIFACVFVNIFFGFYQEYTTSKAIALLKKYLVSYVKVRRDNNDSTIPSTALVVGDKVTINAGDRLFADMRIIQETNLIIDESALTGEAGGVHKTAYALDKQSTSLYDAHNIGFTGTTVLSGTGVGIVFAVGKNTVFGTIAQPKTEVVRESTIVSSTKKLGIFLIKIIIITLISVVIAHVMFKNTSYYSDILIFATTLAISIIPEALPIIVTFCLSSGAAALAKKNVFVKRLSAVEDLGAVDILCIDKTGTLTENRVTIANIYATSSVSPVLPAALAIEFIDNGHHHHKQYTDKGFDHAIFSILSPEQKQEIHTYKTIKIAPYDPERKINSVLVQDQQSRFLLISRGMPEDIIPRCDFKTSPVNQNNANQSTTNQSTINQNSFNQNTLNTWIQQENNQGHRILAIAIKYLTLTEQQANDMNDIRTVESHLQLVGMIALNDPLKKTALEAIDKSKKIGLTIKVISGDSVAVCSSIGQQAHLITSPDQVITGEQLTKLNRSQQVQAVLKHAIFARCLPEHKLIIIKLLQNNHQRNHMVAYLGDGINDIPALKIANVSLAVREAADITRDAADIILLEKSLLVIIDGIKEGRTIIVNTLKYIKITLSNNFGNLYAIAIVSVFLDYLPLLPIHILLINLITDFPLLALSTDSVDPQALRIPQRFSIKRISIYILIMGLISNLFDIITFSLFRNQSPKTIQMAWYLENILTEIVFIFSARTATLCFKAPPPSLSLIILSLTALVMATAPFYTQTGRAFLKLSPLSPHQFIMVLSITGVYFITVELAKYGYYYSTRHINGKHSHENAPL